MFILEKKGNLQAILYDLTNTSLSVQNRNISDVKGVFQKQILNICHLQLPKVKISFLIKKIYTTVIS